MKTKTFDIYVDPGHGWVKAPRKLLADLGIEKQVSSYSYQRGEFVYLEEDCDATLLARTLRSLGIEPKLREHYADRSSKIRSYEGYAPYTNS